MLPYTSTRFEATTRSRERAIAIVAKTVGEISELNQNLFQLKGSHCEMVTILKYTCENILVFTFPIKTQFISMRLALSRISVLMPLLVRYGQRRSLSGWKERNSVKSHSITPFKHCF